MYFHQRSRLCTLRKVRHCTLRTATVDTVLSVLSIGDDTLGLFYSVPCRGDPSIPGIKENLYCGVATPLFLARRPWVVAWRLLHSWLGYPGLWRGVSSIPGQDLLGCGVASPPFLARICRVVAWRLLYSWPGYTGFCDLASPLFLAWIPLVVAWRLLYSWPGYRGLWLGVSRLSSIPG